ncbi:phosphoribosyltransferase-like protein [Rhizobium phage RHph_I1_18]|nr:phosphoribosyltransferase-like protein [Rhizobium phage RHph_I1_18]
MKYTTHSLYKFTSLADVPFNPASYSKLKFGCDTNAKIFGRKLAASFYQNYQGDILSNRVLIIPSPYNYVPNAATVMTHHFINRLNEMIVEDNGTHVELMTIPRKVSYINDYGFLPKETRKSLLAGDSFYLNESYVEGRLLVFIDDVKITGTHEDKLKEILQTYKRKNDAFFLYLAEYNGDQPDIESKINFAGVKTIKDYARLANQPDHHLIVRPIKFLLSRDHQEFADFIKQQTPQFVEKLYHSCLNEGYYRIPNYQVNFQLLRVAQMGL